MKTLNRILAMILAVIMIGSSVPVYADGESGGNSTPTDNEISLTDISEITADGPSGSISRTEEKPLDFHINYSVKEDKAGTTENPGDARTHAVWVYDLSDLLDRYPELTGLDQAGGNVLDGTSVSGTYQIVGNKVKIMPDQDWLNNIGAGNIKGSFTLSLLFDGTKVPSDGNREYQFPGVNQTTSVRFNEPTVKASKTVNGVNNGTVTAEKQGDGTYLLHYQLYVKPDTNLGSLKLTDTLTGTQNFKPDSFMLRKNWDSEQQNIPAKSLNISGNTLTFDLGQYLNGVQAGTEYEIKYDTVIPADKIGETQSNSASWTCDGGKPQDGGSTNVTTKKSLAVTKNVTETGGNTYKYTITVGDGTESLAGHTISDFMSDNQVLQSNIDISPALPGEISTIPASSEATDQTYSNNPVNLFSYTFPERAGSQYTITYTTKAATDPSLYGNQNITNTTTTTDKDGNKGTSSTTKEHNFGTDQSNAQIAKQFDGWDVDKKQAKWTITLTVPEDTQLPLNNVDVKEYCSYGYGINQSGYTPEFDWSNAKITTADGTALTKGTDYTIDTNQNKIHFDHITEAIGRTIIIHLDTTLQNGLFSADGGANIYNEAQVYVNGQYKNRGYAEGKYNSEWYMTKNVTGPDDQGRYKWTVEINPNQEKIDPDIDVYFKDIIPEGMEFAGCPLGEGKISVEYNGNFTGNQWWYSDNNTNNKATGFNVEVVNREIGPVKLTNEKISIWPNEAPKGLSNTRIRVTYYTKIVSDWKQKNDGQAHTFTNTAQVTNSDGTVLKEAKSDLNYTQKYLDKKDISGREVGKGNATVDYQIDVNPDALTINGGNNAYLTDHIADNVELMIGTIKVIDPKTGNEIDKIPKGISYDDKTRELKVYVPDGKHVRVEYSVIPLNVSADGKTAETFTNTAVLHGSNSWSDEEKKDHVVIDHGATLTGEINKVSLRKVSTYDLKTKLPGAEFTLYLAGVNSDNTLNGKDFRVGDPQTTDLQGKVTFGNLTFGNTDNKVLYYWKETKAPDGYAADEDLSTKHYFVLYSINNNNASAEASNRAAADALVQAVNAKNGINARRISGADEWVVTNTKDSFATAEIKGTKKMVNRAMANGEFSFKLTPLSGTDENGKQIDTEKIPMPSNAQVSVPSANETVPEGKESEFNFGTIQYNDPGIYTYKVEENDVTDTTVERDTHYYEVKVIVKRNSDGDLYVEDRYPEYTRYEAGDVKEKENCSEASFVNTQKVGEIVVSKEVKGISGDKNKRFNFTITMDPDTSDLVKNADYKADVTTDETKVNTPNPVARFQNGKFSFDLASGQVYHIYGIPAGTKYTVSEDGTVANGYTTTVDQQSGLVSGKKTVEDDKASSTEFVNTSKAYGNLTISKRVTGNAVSNDDKNKGYDFTLHIDGGEDLSDAKIDEMPLVFDESRNAKVQVNGNSSVTVTNLPLNATYKVTENTFSGAGLAGFTTTYQTEGKTSDREADGTVQEHSSVQVTNTKNLYGGISLQKKVTGNDKFKKTWFAFCITLTGDDVPAGTATYKYTYGSQKGEITFVNGVSLKQNIAGIEKEDFDQKVPDNYVTLKVDKEHNAPQSPVLCITGIPQGTKYQIDEQDYTDTYNTVQYEKATGTVQAVENAYKPEDVTPNNMSEVNKAVITNNRDAYGQLKITKLFEGNAANADAAKGKSITVKLTMQDTEGNPVIGERFGHIFNKDGSTLLTLNPDNKYTVNIEKTIPVGYKYKVEEVTDSQDQYETSSKDYVYVTEKDVYEPVKDEHGETVKGDQGNDEKVKKKKWCELRADGEVNPADQNMADEIRKEKPDTISPQWHKVELTNTKYAWGGFSIEKKLAGSSSDQPFYFHIELSDASVNGNNYGIYGDEKTPITFKDGEANISLKANEKAYVYGLNDGVHYKVTETNIPSDFSESPVYNNAEGDVKATVFNSATVKSKGIYTGEGEQQVFHPEKTADIVEENLPTENQAVITNIHKSASLTITKTLAGNDQSDKGPFEFTIALRKQNGSSYSSTDKLTDGTGQKVTFDEKGNVIATIDLSKPESSTYTVSGLEVGSTYEVTESDSKGYLPSYKVEGADAGNNKATGTIGQNGSIVNVTNTKDSYGGLNVTKYVNGNAGDKNNNRRWKFKLTLGDNSNSTNIERINLSNESSATDENGSRLSELTFSNSGDNGKDSGYFFWLSDKQSLITTSNALPAGISYHVEEVKATDDDKTYSTVVRGDMGTIAKNGISSASFTNTRSEQYSLTLTKFVQSNTDTGTFRFSVELSPYDRIPFSGNVNDVTFSNNVAEVTLKGGESKTLTGLPNGTYTVTEENASDYSTTIKRSADELSDLSIEGKTVSGQFDKYNLIPDTQESQQESTDDAKKEADLNKANDQTVTFTNSKTVYGALRIKKNVNGTGADPKARFRFVIRLSGIYGKDFSDNCSVSEVASAYRAATGDEKISTLAFTPKEVTVNDKDKIYYSESEPFYLGNNDTLEVTGLPSNAAYEVVETDNTFEGLPYEQTTASGMTGFIPEGENAAANATVTNTLPSNGKLTLEKKVTGNTDKSARFWFDLTGMDRSGKPLNGNYDGVFFDNGGKAAVDVRTDENGNGKRELTGLPIGSTITVKERNYTGDGYDAPVYEIGGEEQKNAEQVEVTITSESKDQPISVAIRNNRERPLLRIKKTMKYPEGMSVPNNIVFHVAGDNGFSADLNYKDFSEAEKKDGKALQVPYGIYTVTETGGTVDTYHLTTAYKVDGTDTQRIDLSSREQLAGRDDLTKTIEITNTYAKKGGFTLTKNVTVNDKPAESYSDDALKKSVDGTYWFDILDFNGTPIGRHAEIEVKDGKSETVSVDNLDEGTYFVQENLNKSSGNNVKNMTDLPMQMVSVRDGVTSENTKAQNVSFTNNLVKNGSLEITKKIQVDGKDPEDTAHNGVYSFQITSEDRNKDGLPAYSNTVTVTVSNGKSGAVKVDGLKPGKYIVTEAKESDQNVPVSVTYSSNDVEVKAEETADVMVTNTYTTVVAHPEVQKYVKGDADKHEYSFTLTPLTEGAPMPENTDAKVEVTGNDTQTAAFGNITFTKAGTYEYQITENDISFGGVTKSPEKVTASITLTNDNGKLTDSGFTYEGGTGDQKNVITNTYTPTEAEVNLQVRKQVTNLADEKWPAGGFAFALTQTKGENVLQKPETAAAVSSSSPAAFAPMTFKKAGSYQFEIREVIPDGVKPDQKGVYVKDGITYSTAVHTADVEVTDDHNGKLVAEVTYDGRKDVPTVTNTYGAGGTWTPTATKTVDGKKPNKAFGFELSGVNDNAKEKLPKSATASNDLNGNIVFDPIGFTLEDVGKKFEFRMEETSKDGNGIVTDKTVHDIEVTVSDNGDGTLKVVPVYKNEKSIVFNNRTEKKKPQTPGTGRHDTTVKKTTKTSVSQTTKRSGTSGKVNAPDTGDHNRTAGWALLMLICMLTALAALIVRRRNSK